MDKQVIRLTEAQLKEKIKASLREKIENGELDEGFWKQLKTGAKTFVSDKNKGQGLSGRWDAAKKNYGLQGEKDKFGDILKQLKALVDAGEIDPNLTIGQYIGGPNNKFGKLTGKMANRQAQMNRRM